MNTGIKIALFVVFLVGAMIFGSIAYRNYSSLMTEAGRIAQEPADDTTETVASERVASANYATLLTYGALAFVMLAGLGLLAGHEVSNFIGNRFLKTIYNDEGEGISDPDYEIAEQEWAKGNHLEAIRLLREFLKKNPREQHAALRIAEIYEKDLNNHLAAALEYEEVLKQKLHPERWGWAAIHLCNLYFRLNAADKAVVLLRRIVDEYPETGAAEKARKRLAKIDGTDDAALQTPTSPEVDPANEPAGPPEPEAAPQAPVEPEPGPESNLPRGFRPKKR